MRVVFLGTPEFAVPSLQALIGSSYQVTAVFTQPDRPTGRGQKPHPPVVKILALAHEIPVHQPEKVRGEEYSALVEELHPDFIVVVAYGQILPGWLLKAARIAPVNVHASLLPKYRGAAPVAWALLKGESVTGVTTMLMDERLDTGPVLLKREVPVPESMTAGELATLLSHAGAALLIPTLDGLRDGTLRPVAQDDAQASWAPRILKEEAQIAWEASAREIHNMIRAFYPWPLAFTESRGGKRVQILRSRTVESLDTKGRCPGTFLGKTEVGMLVQCGGGSVLEVLELQLQSRRPTSGREFAIGARLLADTLLFPRSERPE
jgi:methionyl-tRNA formyltransferase